MFFDISRERFFPLLIAGVILFVGVALYVTFDARYQPEQHAQTFFTYSLSDFNYWLHFQFPERFSSLAAAVGLASVEPAPIVTATPTEGNARSIPVLIYHGEGDVNSMPLDVFVRQLKALKANGWQTITMKQFTDYMKNGGTLPDKSFLLTFDDGRKDTYYPVDPVLKDLDYTAVMFVITGFSLETNSMHQYYLSPFELGQMAKSGRWELESHGDQDHRLYTVPTATSTSLSHSFISDQHFMSNLFWKTATERIETTSEYIARITSDLQSSKDQIERTFQVPVQAFAYPFNDFGQDSVNLPTSAGILDSVIPTIYSFAFYQIASNNSDTFNYPNPDNYFNKRIEPGVSWSAERLLSVMESGRAKTIPYITNTFGPEWGGTWGSITTSGQMMALQASPSSTGAAAYLNGSSWWADYRVDVNVDWMKGNSVTIISRHIENSQSYLACTFTTDHIFLERHLGPHSKNLGAADYSFNKAGGDASSANFSMMVHGNRATCSGYGKSVTSLFGTDIPPKGGIGVEVWDPQTNNAMMTVRSVRVEPD